MASTNNEPIQIPLVVDIETRKQINHTNTTAVTPELTSYIQNGVVEVNKNNNTKYVNRRSGYNIDTAPHATYTTILGYKYTYDYNGDVPVDISVLYSGVTDYLVIDNSTGYNLSVSMDRYDIDTYDDAGVRKAIIVGNGDPFGDSGAAFIYNIEVPAAPTKLTNATHGVPNTEYRPCVVILDTYAFILTQDGLLYNSNVGDVTTWTSTDFIDTVTVVDDQKLYMAKHNDHIVVVGTDSFLFYYDAGNPSGSPLNLRQDLTINFGVGDIGGTSPLAYDIVGDEEHLVFASVSDVSGGYTGISLLDNFKVRKISSDGIDRYINSVSLGNIKLGLHEAHGRKFVILQVTSPEITFVYDLSTGLWYKWSFGTDTSMDMAFCSGAQIAQSDTKIITYDETLSRDKTTSPATYTDFPYTIQTPQVNLGTSNNKFCRDTALVGDYTSGQEDVEINWTDDNYQNFSTARTYDLQYHRKLTRCGIFRKRAWKIHQDSTTTGSRYPVRLSHIEVGIDGSTVNTSD